MKGPCSLAMVYTLTRCILCLNQAGTNSREQKRLEVIWTLFPPDVEFQAILAFRQQHRLPSFNSSDLFFVCRLKSLTFELHPCQDEVLKCQWMSLEELAVSEDATLFTHRIVRMLNEGRKRGMASVDIGMEEWPSLGGKSTYKLFLRTRVD